jgi:pyruvate dehydrogenase E1 component
MLTKTFRPIPSAAPSFPGLLRHAGADRARCLLDELARLAQKRGWGWQPDVGAHYVKSIAVDLQPPFPGDLAFEERLAAIMRCNALVMVVRANQACGEPGGHIASCASAADLFETGFHHFFGARNGSDMGDLVFFQPHSAPGVHARACLGGRLNWQDLLHYRQEIRAPYIAGGEGARGQSSYPHIYLMPGFWRLPTRSMGINPINAIFQARFMRYLTHRRLLDCAGREVWGVFGDGKMDQPWSMSALPLAPREGLDNLVWVADCKLQRLDGPVRGNGRIIADLEPLFAGAGWRVIKLVWGSDWDGLFARDNTGALVRAFASNVDGQRQTFVAKDRRYNRDNFFGQSRELVRLAQGMTDEQIDRLERGDHDLVKIQAACAAAAAHTGQSTVIRAHTKKGDGMGSAGQGRMTTHSQKRLDEADLIEFRNRSNLSGRETVCEPLEAPDLALYAAFATQAAGSKMSTRMAFVRMLASLLRQAGPGPRIVPVVADDARTFGMANLFKQVGLYSSVGQKHAPEDIGSVLS